MDQNPPHKFGNSPPCGVTFGEDVKDQDITFPGNFASDAQFFVFTGVISWLYCFVRYVLGYVGFIRIILFSIGMYVFYSTLYMDKEKKYPKIDFVMTALLAMFCLAGSAAWANGLTGLKLVSNPDNWIWNSRYQFAAICYRTEHDPPTYSYTKIGQCEATDRGHFGGANVSVLLGFLNFFLWACNLWFLYKETNWFTGGQAGQKQEEEPGREGQEGEA